MSTPGYPDWTSPVASVDVSTEVTGSPFTLTAPSDITAAFDTSQAASLAVLAAMPVQTLGQRFYLAVSWLESGEVVYQDILTFHEATSYPNASQVGWQLPVRGSSATIAFRGDGTGHTTVKVLTSTRNIQGPTVVPYYLWRSRLLVDTTGTTLTPGQSKVWYVPPVASQVIIGTSISGTTKVRADLDMVYYTGAAMSTARLFESDQSLTVDVFQVIPLEGVACELTLTNNDTVNRLPGWRVWDAS